MRLKKDLTLRRIGSKYMIVDAGDEQVDISSVYTLNKTAAWIWTQVQGMDFEQEELAEKLVAHYEVSLEVALADVRALLETWRKYGLLEE